MSIRTILLPIIDEATAAVTLAAGLNVARHFGAHIEAVHLRYDSSATVPYVVGPMPTEMLVQISETAEKVSDERAERLRAMFAEFTAKAGVPVRETPGNAVDGPSAGWREIVGSLDFRCGVEGRLYDLAVVLRPTEDDRGSMSDVLEGLLFYSGRPVLMMPDAQTLLKADIVTIAWSGSVEAARAVAAAMPMLEQAKRVSVLTVGDDPLDGPSGSDLARLLAWRGVTVDVVEIDEHKGTEGEAILDSAATMGAGLLVMGAYSHSRLRQLILGGVTRDVIRSATIPVMLVH